MGNAPTKGLQKKGNKKYVHWSNADKPTPPGKPQLVPGTPHNQPDVVTIRWEPPANDGGAPVSGYLVEHRRTGSPHWVRATPSLVTSTDLTLSGLEPGWRYQFRVSAENAAGISEPGELSEPLTVTLQRSAAAAPHFTQELKDTMALENDKAEFLVHYRGTPTPKIAWFKDGFEIFSSRRTKILTENETSSLVIFQAAFSDEGEIKCTATNRVGHVVTKSKLRLEAPPRIRLPRQYEDGLLFEMDEVIKLKVSVTGRPLPRVTWFHNGEQVVFGGRYEVANTDRYSSLRVGEAKRHDRGEYQVKATNRLGEDVVAVLVTVTDRPVPPGKAKVVMTLGRSVTLSWTKPEDDGGCKIGNYIVEYYRLGWNVWLKAATCRQMTTTLGDLIEGSEYKFRLKAENPYGVSDPGEESEVVFIPDPKRGILEAPARGSQHKLLLEQAPGPSRDDRKRRRPPIRDSNIPRKEKHLDSSMEYPSSDPDSEAHFKPRHMESKTRSEQNVDTKVIPLTVLEYQKQENKGGKENISKQESPKLKVTDKQKQESMSVPKTKPLRENASRGNKPVKEDEDDIELVPEVYSLKIPVGRSVKSEERDGRKTPTDLSPREDDGSMVHGSSEMMLVLLPETRDAQSETDKEQHADFCRSFAENNNLGVAPPMSLSSPELGCGDPMTPPVLRNAVSSSELLHELAMERLYQEAEAEEKANTLSRRRSLERKRSFERPSEPNLQARNVLRMNVESHPESKGFTTKSDDERGRSVQDKANVVPVGLSMKTEGKIKKPAMKKLLSEEEEEEAEFSRLRERIKKTLEEDSKEVEREMRYKKEDTPPEDEEVEEEDEGTLDDEDLEEEEVDDEDIDEEELEEEESEENPEEEEDASDEENEAISLKDKKKAARRSPPLRSMDYNKFSDDDEEDEPYHPRSMVPRAVLTKELPPPPVPVHREILTVKTLDDNAKESAAPVRHEPKSDLQPKPILKTSSKFGKDDTKTKVKPASPRASTPFGGEAKTKTPILNKILDKIESPFRRPSTPANEASGSNVVVRRQKKSSPPKTSGKAPAQEAERREGDVGLSAAEIARKRRLQTRQSSVEEDQEANKIIIDHYSDIVKEYGIPKKYSPTLYLNTEDLKKAVEQNDDDGLVKSVSTTPEIAPEKSKMLANRYSKPPEMTAKEDILTKYKALAEKESPQYTPSPSPPSSRDSKPFSPMQSKSPTQSPTQSLTSRRNIQQYTPTPSPDLKQSKPKPSSSDAKHQEHVDRYSDENSDEEIPWEFTPRNMMARIRRSLTPKRSFRRQRPDPAILAKTAESRVNNFITYLSDWAMFLLACWLYLFKDERLAIPVLILMVYRQMHAAIIGWIPQRWRRKKE